MIHIVVPLIIVIRRPNVLRISLIGIDVHHPSENVRMKLPARRLAFFLGRDGAEQTEFRLGAEVAGLLSRRGLADGDLHRV